MFHCKGGGWGGGLSSSKFGHGQGLWHLQYPYTQYEFTRKRDSVQGFLSLFNQATCFKVPLEVLVLYKIHFEIHHLERLCRARVEGKENTALR